MLCIIQEKTKSVSRIPHSWLPICLHTFYFFFILELEIGIVQRPFIRLHVPNYLNYGGIGAVIGHEIIHGFDNKGLQFDKSGEIADWWSKESKAEFNNRAQCLVEQYGNFSYPDLNLKVNIIILYIFQCRASFISFPTDEWQPNAW